MPSNRGHTSLRGKPSRNSMRDYDRLPPELRVWIASANLPWRPRSVLKTYEKQIAKTGSPERALRELDRIQSKLLAKDTLKIWGREHPDVRP